MSVKDKKRCGILIIIIAGVLAYSTAFYEKPVFDDNFYFKRNPQLRVVWPPWEALRSTSRPFHVYNMALENKFLGSDLWHFHLINIIVHIASAILLFLIINRVCLLPSVKKRLSLDRIIFAGMSSLIWVLHPLQTETVTYVNKRSGGFMTFFLFLTIYGFLRGVTEKSSRWLAVSAFACFAGMGHKELMVVAPVLVFLFDWLFVSDSLKVQLKERWKYYLTLALSWCVLGVFLYLSYDWYQRKGGRGFDSSVVTPLNYLITQFGVVANYLRIFVWPDNLAIDYRWPMATGFSDFKLEGLLVVGLVGVTIYGLVKKHPLSFLGLWFIVVLAPTSSIMPMADAFVEHRLYAPLVAPSVFIAFVLVWLYQRQVDKNERGARLLELICALVLLVGLGTRTYYRNMDYETPVKIWESAIRTDPGNVRAYYNLSATYNVEEEPEKVIDINLKALSKNPYYLPSLCAISNTYLRMGNLEKAGEYVQMAYELFPENFRALIEYGIYNKEIGNIELAEHFYKKAMNVSPYSYNSYYNLGVLEQERGNLDKAADYYKKVLELYPTKSDSLCNLGGIYFEQGDRKRALELFEKALLYYPKNMWALYNIGLILRDDGDYRKAVSFFTKALLVKPDFAEAYNNRGVCYWKENDRQMALNDFRKALELKPDYAGALQNVKFAEKQLNKK